MTTQARTKGNEERSNADEAKRSSTRRQDHGSGRPEEVDERLGPGPKDHPLLGLQRTHGNRAVQRLVNERIRPTVQPKLKVGQPDDEPEREAERVADAVMRMPRIGAPTPVQRRSIRSIQRECAGCEEREREEEILRTKPVGPGRTDGEIGTQAAVPPLVGDVLRSPGRPLDPVSRAFMESSIGHDFSRVRVHVGAQAAASAREIDASAYAMGHDLVFGTGQYAPTTPTGRRLLAHELTHVVQQDRTSSAAVVRRKPDGEGTEFRIRVRFPFVKLGIPKDTPGPELAIRFMMWYRGLSREEATHRFENASPTIRRAWDTIEGRDTGEIVVAAWASADEFAPQQKGTVTGEALSSSGRSERHEERAEEFRGLPSEIKKAINAETDRRWEEATGLTGKIRKGEEGKAEAWLRLRDQVLAEREFLRYLPERVKRFMALGGGKKERKITPEEYPRLISITQLIMDMSDEEVNDFLSERIGVTADLDEFEKTLEGFIAAARTDDGGKGGGGGTGGEKKGSKYGRFGLIDLPQPIITVLEAAAEVLGDPEELNDLLDLFDEITELRESTADVVNVLGDPENLLLVALGLLDNSAVAALDRWVFKPTSRGKKKARKPRKRKGVKGVLQKVRRALSIVKKVLRPVFLARRKSMGVQFRAALLIDELPAAATSVLERAVGSGEEKNVAAEVTTLADTVAEEIRADLEKVPEALGEIGTTGTIELIDKEALGRIVAKLTVKLAGGVYGKVASKVGLDEAIADIAKHGTKYAIPDAVVDAINSNLNRIVTEFKPRINEAAAAVTDIVNGIDTVLSERLRPELTKLVSPKATAPDGARLRGSEAGFQRRIAASSGAPLSGAVRRRLAPVFGSALGSVSIHTDQAAQEASRAIDADAFTIGSDVYFGPGQFDEQSGDGLGLIAHELTHVVQHGRGTAIDTIRRRETKRSLRDRLATRLVGRVLRGTGKTKRSIRGTPFVDYGYIDGKGRPQGIIARLQAPLGTGSSASKSIRPPGFKGAPGGHARCHLLAAQLGGSGRDPRNLVACHQALNNTDMRAIESQVKKAVQAGETVLYKVIPEYRPRGRMPRKIRIIAKGDGSPATNIDETLVNRT